MANPEIEKELASINNRIYKLIGDYNNLAKDYQINSMLELVELDADYFESNKWNDSGCSWESSECEW